MLLTNFTIRNSSCGRDIGGFANLWGQYNAPVFRNYYIGGNSNESTDLACFHTGTQPPYSFMLADKGGELSSTTLISGATSVVTNLTKGIGIATDIAGAGDITVANLSLIIQLAASILGEATLSASLVGKLEMASTIAGSGDLTSALSLIANVVTEMSGSGTVEATAFGTADMSATFSSSSTLSPENLAAAVWNSVAAAFNTAGTMGNKLNSAASAGDPWGTALPGSYLSTEAGGILARIQELVDELHQLEGLKSGSPMTVTPTSRTVGSINLEISGDGETETIVTRQ